MAAFQCFFCAKFAQCPDHRAECNDFEGRRQKTVKRSNKITVEFKD